MMVSDSCIKKLGKIAEKNGALVFRTFPDKLDRANAFGNKFWCPFCKRWHFHGEGDGHRVAHCGPRIIRTKIIENLHPNGYVIKRFSKTELIKIKKDIELYLLSERGLSDVTS